MQERLAGCLNIASEWSKPIFNNAKGRNAKIEIQRGNQANNVTCIPEMCSVGCLGREKCAQLVAYDQIRFDKVFFRRPEIFWNINAAKVESWSFFVFHVEIHLGQQNAIFSLESKRIENLSIAFWWTNTQTFQKKQPRMFWCFSTYFLCTRVQGVVSLKNSRNISS